MNPKFFLGRIFRGCLILAIMIFGGFSYFSEESNSDWGYILKLVFLVLSILMGLTIFKNETIKGFLLMIGEKNYALGTVVKSIRKSGSKSGPFVKAEYDFKVDGVNYTSDVIFKYKNKGDEGKYLHQQYIVAYLKNNPSNCDIIEKISVKGFNLKQPTGGWSDRDEIPVTPDELKRQAKNAEESLAEMLGKKYREDNAELYNPIKHEGWERQEYVEKEEVKFEWNKAKEMRYSFSDGRIVYASINALGMVAVPPSREDFKSEVVREVLYNKKIS